MTRKTSLIQTALAALALTALVPAASAADWDIYLLGDHSKNFSREHGADEFLAAYSEANDAGVEWETVATVIAAMPEEFKYQTVPFERVRSLALGGFQVHLYRDTVRGERDPSRIHAFAIDADALDDDPIETLDTVAWARDEAAGASYSFTVGGRLLVIALASHVRSDRNEVVTKGVVKHYLDEYDDTMYATLEADPNHDDWNFLVACWRQLASISTEVELTTFYDSTKIDEITPRIVPALIAALNSDGKALLEKREAAARKAAEDSDVDDGSPWTGGVMGI